MSDDDKANILIVDDLPEKLLVYRTILEELGQNLIEVRSGADALKQVLKHDFAVILLDVNMPGMDGFETAQLIRQRKRSGHTPIIFITAFADEVRTAQGYATGGVDYIPTPVVPEILRAKVRVFVELFRMRQQMAHQAEEQAKRAAAEESARRSAFLAEASRALASSLDVEATLEKVAQLATPHLADVCLVTLAGETGLGATRCAFSDVRAGARLRTVADLPLDDGVAQIVSRTVSRGRMQMAGDPGSPGRVLVRLNGEAADDLPDFLVGPLLSLPLVARGRTLGALTVAHGPSGRRFSPADITLVEELSGRAAVALDNALLVRDIQEADRRKNEFLAMLAHELRNPLAPVRNAVHVMRMRGEGNPELTWARDVIDRQVTHLVRMVDDLLDVSRITRGKIQLSLEPMEVEHVVSRAVETSRPLIEAHNHRLTVSLPEEPLRVKGDGTRLGQVLANLLNNAAKYTPDGGQIELRVTREEGEAVFRVRDSGAGIPREMLTKVFDLFTQVERSLDRSQGGLGIGLTLVQRLVELHGGRVEAFSEGVGKGSEFVVRLPVFDEGMVDAECPASTEAMPAIATITHRVLVVDDNVDAADSLGMILRLNGHQVAIAHDGPGALAAAESFQPEAVLLDIGLPVLDGYEVARRLRRSDAGAGLLLVAVSGYGQEEDRLRSREAGFDHHLTKPVAFADLEDVLRTLRPPQPGPRLTICG